MLWPTWSRSSPRSTAGPFEQSLQSLRRAIAESTQEKQATAARAALAPAEVIGICEAYYQRLVEGNQFAIAREAFRLVLEQPYVLPSRTSSQAV